jgi:hypothetical protein
VRSSFKAFIETNLMVQSKFNLVFLFVSYNIFYRKKKLTRSPTHLFLLLSLARVRGRPPSGPVPDNCFTVNVHTVHRCTCFLRYDVLHGGLTDGGAVGLRSGDLAMSSQVRASCLVLQILQAK